MLQDNGATLLLTEMNHRVMNSFQVISALASRFNRVQDLNDLPPILDDLTDRLAAFAALHRQLATPPHGCFAGYCSSLGTNLVAAFGRLDAVVVTMDPVILPPSWRARIALIVAELLTNCLKHSLTSTAPGSIRLELRLTDDRLIIEAQDSAAPPVSQPLPEPSRVVLALAASLGGETRVVDRDGYCAQVSLPIASYGMGPSNPSRTGDFIRTVDAGSRQRLSAGPDRQPPIPMAAMLSPRLRKGA